MYIFLLVALSLALRYSKERDVVVLNIMFLCIGMIYNYRMLRNVLGMKSTPLYPINDTTLNVRLAIPSELTHYYLNIA